MPLPTFAITCELIHNRAASNFYQVVATSRNPQFKPIFLLKLEYKFCSEIRSGEGFGLGLNCRRFPVSKFRTGL